MTPADLLHGMRSKGYSVARDGARLVVSGPKPPDPERAKAALDANRDALLSLLGAEEHPVVQRALEAFPDARIVEVRSAQRTISPSPGGAESQKQGPSASGDCPGGPNDGQRAAG